MSELENVDFSLAERRLIAGLIDVVMKYLDGKSNVPATFTELRKAPSTQFWFNAYCAPADGPAEYALHTKFLQLVVNRLVAEGKLLEVGSFLLLPEVR